LGRFAPNGATANPQAPERAQGYPKMPNGRSMIGQSHD
jgi:hypothetical protein